MTEPIGEVSGLESLTHPVARRLASHLQRDDPGVVPRLRLGTVQAINSTDPPTLDVLLNGAPVAVPRARYMSGYVPLMNDNVWCLQNGSDLLVLGDLQARANSVSALSTDFVAGNWYRIAWTRGGATDGAGSSTNYGAANPRAHGRFVIADGVNGRHARIEFGAGISWGKAASAYVSTAYSTSFAGSLMTKARIVYKGTYDRAYLDLWFPTDRAYAEPLWVTLYDNDWPDGWVLNPNWNSNPIPDGSGGTSAAGYLIREWLFADEGDSWNVMALLNGWTAYDPGAVTWEVPAWRYGTDGHVHLQGLMKHATTTTTGAFYNFGKGLKPNKSLIFLADCQSGVARVDVNGGNGDISLQGYKAGGNGTYVSLTGLYWRPFK